MKFSQLMKQPIIRVNEELHQLTGLKKDKEVNFWKELTEYVVCDRSIHLRISPKEYDFEIYRNGFIRYMLNAEKFVNFLEAAKVEIG